MAADDAMAREMEAEYLVDTLSYRDEFGRGLGEVDAGYDWYGPEDEHGDYYDEPIDYETAMPLVAEAPDPDDLPF